MSIFIHTNSLESTVQFPSERDEALICALRARSKELRDVLDAIAPVSKDTDRALRLNLARASLASTVKWAMKALESI